MYFYLYDSFLREKKYEGALARIESRLVDLGLQGKSEKLTILKSMHEVVESAIQRGAETVVVVGDDRTVSKVLPTIAKANVLFGFIPLGEHNTLAHFLGIPQGEKACDVLSARIIEQLDLGKANTVYFLSFVDITSGDDMLVECDKQFHVEALGGPHSVSVHNFGSQGRDPHDGVLELVVHREGERKKRFRRSHNDGDSVFPVQTARIKSYRKSLAGYADGQTVVKTPLTITVAPKKLRMIVGKKRGF